MGDLTAHFDTQEFVDHSDGSLVGPAVRLLGVLENLRAQNGNRPLAVISGYRSPQHNADVGGAPDSRHMYGDAADLESGWCTVAMAEAAGARGIGVHDGWVVHVDTRPAPPVTFDDP
jgi:zinc D-Ala-D-Ala carboxypeptidase